RLALKAVGYGGDGPPPELPAEVWAETSARYVQLYEALTGTTFVPGATPVGPRIEANLAPVLTETTTVEPAP
ncbi:MAG: hypothetical protein AAF547_19700, partial [Actinomycetota bacterium]